MPRYVMTDPQVEALKACWNTGSAGIPDHNWAAVQVALDLPHPDGIGRVSIDLSEQEDLDLREGFEVGFGAFDPEDARTAALAGALAGVADMLDVAPARSFSR